MSSSTASRSVSVRESTLAVLDFRRSIGPRPTAHASGSTEAFSLATGSRHGELADTNALGDLADSQRHAAEEQQQDKGVPKSTF